MLVGNCQIGPVFQLLSQSKSFSETYRLIPLPSIHTIDEATRSDTNLLNNVDLIISQHIIDEAFGIFTTKKLVNTCRDHGIPFALMFNPYFEGYYPCVIHMCDVDIERHNVPISQDAIVFYSYVKGLDVDDACRLWINISSSSALEDFARQACVSSFKELIRREKCLNTKSLDLHFLLNNYRKKRLMHSLNHPTNIFYKEMAENLLTTIGINETLTVPQNELQGAVSYPTMDAVRSALRLSYKDESNDFIVLGVRKKLIDYVAFLYDFYKREPCIVEKNISLQVHKLDGVDRLTQSL